jgi:hypothetical protein
MQGVIQAMEYSKKGAPKFKINNSWYYAGRCKVEGLHVGAEIEFESNLFGEQNNLNGLQWWKPVRGGQPAQAQDRANGYGAKAPAASTTGVPTGPVPDAVILPFISNTVAHAIQAGLIKTPEDLTGWVMGARAALSAKATARPESRPGTAALSEVDEEFDDEIPF